MIHTLFNPEMGTTMSIDETICENTMVSIENNEGSEVFHYMSPKDLNNLISTLLHVQAKKRKEFKTKY